MKKSEYDDDDDEKNMFYIPPDLQCITSCYGVLFEPVLWIKKFSSHHSEP